MHLMKFLSQKPFLSVWTIDVSANTLPIKIHIDFCGQIKLDQFSGTS